MIDYTVVIGVDQSHLEKLALVTQTWAKHKPSLFNHEWVVFVDDGKVKDDELLPHMPHKPDKLTVRYWPDEGVVYPPGIPGDKWSNTQRYKMLAGFVHVPPLFVRTKYWCKIDLDIVATSMDDWVDEKWFDGYPAIIAPKWHYTKPPDQMEKLDAWVANNSGALPLLSASPPLALHPNPGAELLKHPRIASWCAFFETEFTRLCSKMAERTCGRGLLPCPSQDGYHFYVAKRLGLGIVSPPMKNLGWEVRSTRTGIADAVRKSLGQ
jgi:hypothetical protein